MIERMYIERKANIPVFRGCDFHCVYCGFGKMLKLSLCTDCKTFKPHTHIDALDKRPPPTKEGEFLTVGLSGDISFASDTTMQAIIHYCWLWSKHTFLIQSKNPAFFLQYNFPDNVIIGTTIETNKSGFDSIIDIDYIKHKYHDYADISTAPFPIDRYDAMMKLDCRKSVTIEPILTFELDTMVDWINKLKPEIVWIGYDSGNYKLPEPSWKKTQALIGELLASGIDVREKLLRKAWWET